MSTNPIDPPVPESPSPAEVASESEVALHFNFPRPDIILRSRDSHNFHVSKLYVVNSSPLLRELIRTVSITCDVANGDEEPESLPVVKLPDRGATLHGLLTFTFPVVPILPSTSDEIIELLATAQKYQMDSVLSHIRGIIARKDPPFIRPETAFRIYFLAQQHELREEAVQSARVTLRLPMVLEHLVDKLDSPGMTGAYLHELWRYHEQVRSDLKSGVLEFRNSGLPEDVKGLRCITRYFRPTYSTPDLTHPPWLDAYTQSIADAPHLFDLISFENAWAFHLQTKAQSSATCSCVGISSQIIRNFWEALTAVVHGAIEKADSTLALVKDEPTPENSDASSVPLCLHVPEANIILRSSDQINFPVHKSLLSMSSSFFETIFTLPQPLAPDDEVVGGLPVVQLPEDADLLSCLISLLYPIPTVIPGSYQKVFALLAACQKYEMVLVQQDIREKVKHGTFPAPVKTEAFCAYAIASSLRLEPEKEHAARLTLDQPLTFESLGQELRQFTVSALCELIRYRVANSGRGNR